MKKTIAEVNETKTGFFEKINKIDKPYPDSSRQTGQRSVKLIKLEITKKLLWTSQKYKAS